MKRLLFLIAIVVLLAALTLNKSRVVEVEEEVADIFNIEKKYEVKSSPQESVALEKLPEKKILNNSYHIFQTFNNCGPASLSMALSYYDIDISQKKLGEELRPFQNQAGDNDDKSVTLAELAQKSTEYGFVPFFRPAGNIEVLKFAIAHELPVIIKTWLTPTEDIGHYRVVKGYDDTTKQIIQDDSYQGKNLYYTYDYLDQIWKKFNYEYLLLVPKDKVAATESFLGKNADEKSAWETAMANATEMLAADPNDVDARFNLVVALYNLQKYEQVVEEYEKVADKLTPRALWYQIEPIAAYYELGNYDKVFEISDYILSHGNRAYSELYVLRGKSYLAQGNKEQAKKEFEQAAFYNPMLQEPKDELAKLN